MSGGSVTLKRVIYKFITEELFPHEMDDMRIPGTTYHFIYQEFHPNHDYDLRSDSAQFINSLLARTWNPKFDSYKLLNKVSFSGREYNIDGISAIIKTFQEAHRSFDVEKFEINEVVIAAELTDADECSSFQTYWLSR